MEGIARFIFETTKRMVLSHPEVTFHFFFDRPFDDKFIFGKNVVPHIIQPPSRHPILWYIWFEFGVTKKLKQIKADVFLSGDMYMSLKTQVPTVMVSHDLNYIHFPKGLKWSHYKYLKHFFPKYHKAASHIVAVSEYTKSDIQKQYGINGDKISVAYNSAPLGFEPMDLIHKKEIEEKFSNGSPFFLYLGSIHPRKNIKRLLLAFDKFKEKDKNFTKLLLYGRMAFKTKSILNTYKKLKYKDDILFVNNEMADIRKILPAAKGLCYVSLFEGFGIPILEGFNAGVPVITSNCSSMPEVAGSAACLVDPTNIDDIANGLFELSENNELRDQLIKEGHIQKSKFSWETSAKIIFNCLKDVSTKKD